MFKLNFESTLYINLKRQSELISWCEKNFVLFDRFLLPYLSGAVRARTPLESAHTMWTVCAGCVWPSPGDRMLSTNATCAESTQGRHAKRPLPTHTELPRMLLSDQRGWAMCRCEGPSVLVGCFAYRRMIRSDFLSLALKAEAFRRTGSVPFQRSRQLVRRQSIPPGGFPANCCPCSPLRLFTLLVEPTSL